ncbi:MAG: Ferredoxin--NADP(+) reductase, partial [uncultured Acetobacteraceae bacterium]
GRPARRHRTPQDPRRLPRRGRDLGPPLDRPALLVPMHPRRELPLRRGPVRHDRPHGGRQAAGAGLFDGQRAVGGGAGVPVHQGAGRPAHLPPPAREAGRHGADRPQGHRHPADGEPSARPDLVAALHRHRHRALHEPDPRAGGLRPLRARGAGAHRPRGEGTGLPRPDLPRAAEPRVPRRTRRRQAALLSEPDARAVLHPGPDHDLDRKRPHLRRPRPAAALARGGPRDALRVGEHERGRFGHVGGAGLRGGLQPRTRQLRGREGFRDEV